MTRQFSFMQLCVFWDSMVGHRPDETPTFPLQYTPDHKRNRRNPFFHYRLTLRFPRTLYWKMNNDFLPLLATQQHKIRAASVLFSETIFPRNVVIHPTSYDSYGGCEPVRSNHSCLKAPNKSQDVVRRGSPIPLLQCLSYLVFTQQFYREYWQHSIQIRWFEMTYTARRLKWKIIFLISCRPIKSQLIQIVSTSEFKHKKVYNVYELLKMQELP